MSSRPPAASIRINWLRADSRRRPWLGKIRRSLRQLLVHRLKIFLNQQQGRLFQMTKCAVDLRQTGLRPL